ncbi:hypothetical protein HDU92_002185 [Lobulomyces angularis]|nr:hypothetical protein HDU92_002185 [Lobulomyces angularis]
MLNIDTIGMYDFASIPSATFKPQITITLEEASYPINLAILIYNIVDSNALHPSSEDLFSICGQGLTISEGLCSESDIGKFVVKNMTLNSAIENRLYTLNDSSSLKTFKLTYDVTETGFYCTIVYPESDILSFLAKVEYKNPYGYLPGSEYPKLPLYGFLSLVYVCIGFVWMGASFLYWKDLLPIQNYLSGVIFFLMLEQAFNYGYYENYNRWGQPSNFLMIVVAVLNAGRNSISFFILLIVSLGYGVVRPTLGGLMKKCAALAVSHFIFGILYSAGSMIVEDLNGVLVMLFVMPLSLTMTMFYYWTLTGLDETMNRLKQKRQGVKMKMYKTLWQILVFSIFSLFLSFMLNSVNFHFRSSTQWVPYYWKYRWVLLDGWLNVLYLCIFGGILILWRPTENNQRYGLDELAQDDFDEFDNELGSITKGNLGQNISHRNGRNTNTDSSELFNIDSGEENSDSEVEDTDEDVLNWAETNIKDRNSFNDWDDSKSRSSSESRHNKIEKLH